MYPWIFNAAAPIDPDLECKCFGSNGYGSINVLHAMNLVELKCCESNKSISMKFNCFESNESGSMELKCCESNGSGS